MSLLFYFFIWIFNQYLPSVFYSLGIFFVLAIEQWKWQKCFLSSQQLIFSEEKFTIQKYNDKIISQVLSG